MGSNSTLVLLALPSVPLSSSAFGVSSLVYFAETVVVGCVVTVVAAVVVIVASSV